MSKGIVCAICERELVPPLDQHYVGIHAWEKPGRGLQGQSGSSLVLRERTGELAHLTCIVGIQHGVNLDQLTFAS